MLKMGAFGSLLTEIIKAELFIPSTCWKAPLMPRARYSLGAKPNPKRIALYERGIGEIDGAESVIDTTFADKVLLIINRRFILHQAEAPGGMVRLGMITDEDASERAGS